MDLHDNRATAGVAADRTFQFAILPMAKIVTEALDQQVIDFYYPGYHLQLSDIEPRDQLSEAQTAVNLFKSGIITLNEARLSVGQSSIGSEGEVFFPDLNTDDTENI